MISTSTCPDVQKWQQLLLGELPDDEAEVLEQHLSACAVCLQTVREAQTDDMLAEAFRSQRSAEEQEPSETVQRLIQQLKGMRPTGNWPTPGAETLKNASLPAAAPGMGEPIEQVFDFLDPAEDPGELGRLGCYRIVKVLGAGGMGIVFEAEDMQLNRRIALKIMKPDVAARPGFRERFLREAQAAAALEHDHIVSIYQVGEERGIPFFAMPLLKGISLSEWLQGHGQIPIAQILRLGRQIALGLEAAHQRGLIHRDIKPANLWLEDSAACGLAHVERSPSAKPQAALEEFRIKILDFGLARPTADTAPLTEHGVIVGTPQYMSPEQARGVTADHRCDLFSLGVVLYRMCTGELPFRGEETLAALSSLALDTPASPQSLNPSMPAGLDALVMQLLAKEQADRPASAREVADRLQILERDLAAAPLSKAVDIVPLTPIRSSERVTALDRRAPSRWGGRLLASAVVLLLLLPLGYFFAGTVTRIVTNQGVLIIKSGGPDIVVTIKDKTATVHDKAGKRTFELTAGDYEVEVRELGEGGLRFATRKVTITRNGNVIFNAHLELVSPPIPPVPPEVIKAVHGVLAEGGKITLRVEARDWEVKSAKELPAEPFKVIGVNLEDHQQKTAAVLAHLALLTDIRSLNLARSSVHDDALVHLKRLTNLAELNLANTRVGDEGLAYLKELKGLKTLDLRGTRVKDDGLEHLQSLGSLKELNLHGTGVTDDGLFHLKGLTNLQTLYLTATPLKGSGLVHLKSLSRLRYIELQDTNVNDAGLAHLRALTGLKKLGLARTKVTDAGLVALKPLTHLEYLQLGGTKVSDHGLENLEGLRELTYLVLSQTEVTDIGLRHLRGLVHLRVLSLHETRVKDAGLANLAEMQQLNRLLLSNTNVSDAGLDHVKKLPRLLELYISGTKVTGHGVAALRKTLPVCEMKLDERQMAEWLLLMGHQITIVAAGQEREISRVEELPADSFQVTGVSIDGAPGGYHFTDVDLYSLTALSNIQSLTLKHTEKISDVGLVHLESLTKLTYLHIAGVDVTDAGLKHIQPLTNLMFLTVEGTKGTDAGLKYIKALTKLTNLRYSSYKARIGDAGFVDLKELTRLRYLVIHPTQVSDAGLVHLQGLTNLQTLILPATVTDAGLVHLKPLTRLERLDLYGPITDAGLVHLKGLANLRSLEIRSPQVTDAGLKHLKPFTKLQKVHLVYATVSDAGLQELALLTDLSLIMLYDTKNVTGPGLAHLKALTKLLHLDFRRTPINDDGLEHLFALPNLQKVQLDGTKVTPAGFEALCKALPRCKIELDERQTAEWLLSRGQKLTIFAADKEHTVSHAAELPAGSFQVVAVLGVDGGSRFSDADLPFLVALTNLKKLVLNSDKITDAGLIHLQVVPHLQELEIRNVPISDTGLVHLKPLTKLTYLDLHGTKVTDAGLQYLKPLTSLTRLLCRGIKSNVGDAGLTHLQELTSLKMLDLGGSKVSDAGLVHLKPLTSLRVLDLRHSRVTNAGLVHLQPLTGLQTLILDFTKVGDGGLRELAPLTNLEHLGLSETEITSAGMMHLTPFTKLTRLDIGAMRVDDASLIHLVALPNLRDINLTHSKVTAPGVLALRKALRMCRFHMDERQTANWLLSMGHRITIVTAGNEREISKLDELPTTSFRVTRVLIDGAPKGYRFSDVDLYSLTALSNLDTLTLDNTEKISDAGLVHLASLTRLTVLSIRSVDVTDAGLKHLQPLTNLTFLDVTYTKATDAGLKYVEGLTKLNSLAYGRPKSRIEGAALAHLKPLSKLERLTLFGPITDAGLVRLGGLTNLRALIISHGHVTDAGLKHLMPLTNLQSLLLQMEEVSDAGLKELVPLTNLTRIALLDMTNVTGAGLAHLKSLDKLSYVDLRHTPIDDDGLKHLFALAHLQEVRLRGTKVTPAGVEALRKAFPRCKIELDERQTAEWLLSKGQKLTILAEGKEQTVGKAAELPADMFEVVAILGVADNGSRLTDADLPFLAPLTNLKKLILNQSNNINDAALVHLKALTNLEELHLIGSPTEKSGITGKALVHLRSLNKLQSLSLQGTQIDDAGLLQLADLPKLARVCVADTQVTQAGADALRKARPSITVVWEPLKK